MRTVAAADEEYQKRLAVLALRHNLKEMLSFAGVPTLIGQSTDLVCCKALKNLLIMQDFGAFDMNRKRNFMITASMFSITTHLGKKHNAATGEIEEKKNPNLGPLFSVLWFNRLILFSGKVVRGRVPADRQ